ncbi:MAG: cysteine desulfurase family protein [Acidobacteriota bacterium]
MIYLDHNATTPLDPRVRAAMQPWLSELHGNPSSPHAAGRQARQAVEAAREQVAALIGGQASEILFTASGTEANNTVIYGTTRRCGFRGHLVTTLLEHPSVRQAAQWATQQQPTSQQSEQSARLGVRVTELTPGSNGCVSPETVEAALEADTRLVCSMHANNELGTVQPVAGIAEGCRRHGVPVLCDAVQAIGKIRVDVGELGVDYLTLAGHKFHGPSGVAALWIRRGAELEPLLRGGAQEGGRRASTENVPAIVGLGEAAALARAELDDRAAHLRTLRDQFEAGLGAIPESVVHCTASERLPHTSHVAFSGVSGYELMLRLDAAGIAVSTGSACHAGEPQASAAVVATGVSAREALASLRVSFGMTNTPEDVTALLAALSRAVEPLRASRAALAV